MSHYKSLVGNRYGMLTVLERVEDYVSPKGSISTRYRCKCDCGNEILAVRPQLVYGGTISCGCYRKNKNKKQNEYSINGDVIEVNHPKGKILLDIEDIELVRSKKFYVGKNGYVYIDKVLLHRHLLNEKNGIVDHINHNKLDNRRNNLRSCDYSINGINKRCSSNTGYIGISRSKKGYFNVSIDSKYIGVKHTLEDAIRFRNEHLEGSKLAKYNTFIKRGEA